ncbi:MAG: hypothetical protein ACK5PP_19780 [Acidimicrobiales bacterium]
MSPRNPSRRRFRIVAALGLGAALAITGCGGSTTDNGAGSPSGVEQSQAGADAAPLQGVSFEVHRDPG